MEFFDSCAWFPVMIMLENARSIDDIMWIDIYI